MGNPPTTRPSLLMRLRDRGEVHAWKEFVDAYAPLVYGYLRRRGLQDADAADLMQEVLRAVSIASARFEYDPNQGSFRGWLFTIVRNKLRNFQASAKSLALGTGDTGVKQLLEQQPSSGNDDESIWIQEYERHLFGQAAERVRRTVVETTWQAFWMTAVEGRKATDVSRILNLSVAAVYLARSRVLARMRHEVQDLQGDEAPF